jgi:hypothetical protein
MADAALRATSLLSSARICQLALDGCPRSSLGYPYGAWREPILTPVGLVILSGCLTGVSDQQPSTERWSQIRTTPLRQLPTTLRYNSERR